MAKPHEITHVFATLPPNIALLEKLWKKYQQAYIRTRLHVIKLLWQGHSRQEVMTMLRVSSSSIVRWMRTLVEHGVDAGLYCLATPKSAPKSGKLSALQQQALLTLLDTHHPSDYGFEQHTFTGAILVHIIQQKWQITVTDQTIYNILARNAYSYQRGHRDYAPAHPKEQAAYGEQVKKSSNPQKTVKK